VWLTRRIGLRLFFLSLLLLLLFGSFAVIRPVNASGQLDQQQTFFGNTGVLFYTSNAGTPPHLQFFAQTFTAGLTGSLTEVDLSISRFSACSPCGPVVVEIHAGSPTGALLASTSDPASSFPLYSGPAAPFFAFIFTAPAPIVALSVYAIVVTTSSATFPDSYVIWTSNGGPMYTGGTPYYTHDGSTWNTGLSYDFDFKTFVGGSFTTTTLNCDPSTIDVGSSSSCTATVSGASGSISGEMISWSQSGGTGSVTFPSGSSCALSGTSCSITVMGAGVGGATVQASYPGDLNNHNIASSGTSSLTVDSMLVAPTVTATQTTINQGQNTTLTSTPVTTGTPPYTYQWFVKDPADSSYSSIPGASSSSYTFTTSASTVVGVWSFELKVTDSDSSVFSNTVTVTVNNPAPPIPEYPLGLPLLAVFMIFAYGLIKRRIRNPKDT
jgi:hypothetical protein